MASNVSMELSLEEARKHPLWTYVYRFEKYGGGGNVQWECNYCHKKFKSTYTRVKSHLLKMSGQGIGICSKVSVDDLSKMQKDDQEASERIKNAELKKVPLPPSSVFSVTNSMSAFFDSKKRKTSGCGSGSGSGGSRSGSVSWSGGLEKAFNMGARDQLNTEIARMFYLAGLPFTLARNPYFISVFSYAANTSIPGYVPPGYNLLRTTLLQREKANIDRLLVPTRSMWSEKGVSIVSDGWSDSQRRPLINFIAVMDGQPMFLKAVDCSGETKDKIFIANLLKDVINEVGHENVVQVITDNASNCKGAGLLIESEFPSIVWTPCVVHTLNLALNHICAAKMVESNQLAFDKCSWITDIVGDVLQVKNFIMNHSIRLAIFNDHVKLKLLSVAETRFASSLVMLKRLKQIKKGLQEMVICDKWSCYRDDDLGKANFIKEKILSDTWWESIDYILSFTEPIYDMLRACDTDKPCLHLVYDMWDTMIEKVKKAIFRHEKKEDYETSPFYDVVYEILIDRWNKNNTPLHCLAHSLNPRYYSEEWLKEDPRRVPPHKDAEISSGRAKCLKKYFPSIEDRNRVNMEYINFISKSGDFNDFDSITSRYSLDPMAWWLLHGSSAPMLQTIASKILVQPSSSSCAERNWSTYSFVHSLRRNQMDPKRAENLVFIHSNLRLLSRRSPQYNEGATKMWDIAGDTFGSFEDIGELNVANLSLDEPDLEAVVFMDDAQGDGDEVEVSPNEYE